MAEEFINDIIAASDSGISVDASKSADATEGRPDLSSQQDASEKVIEQRESSSTPDDAEPKKDLASPDSGDSSNAPGGSPEVEELAAKLGWNKDHKGAESIDAATYILRSKDIQKTMKEHNKDLKSQLTGLQGSVEALKDHNERVYQADVKKLQGELVILKKEKKAAVELADVAKVEELDQQIEDVQKDINAPIKEAPASNNPDFDDWIVDNNWYLTDPEMTKYADTVAEQYAGAPLKRIYDMVRQRVAEVFPDKFVDVAADETSPAVKPVDKVIAPKSPVESGSRNDASASFTKADLSPDQLAIMTQFVRGGIMTEDQYVNDIAKMQGA